MVIVWTEKGWAHYLYWQETDKRTLKRINDLIKAIQRDPFTGIGDPEPLKFAFSGYWSRRIDLEHRIIYKVVDQTLTIVQCRFHYGNNA